MRYEDLQKCIGIAESKCSLSGMRISDADVSILKFQDGANGKIKQTLCFTFEYSDARISLEITPKGSVE